MKNRRNRLIIIVSIVLFIDIIIPVISIVVPSKSPNYIQNFDFSISDFIQLLVVEAALLGPFLFDYWKQQKDHAKIIIEDVKFSGLGDLTQNPMDFYLLVTLKNESSVRVRNCKVILDKITILQKGELLPRIVKLENYLSWLSLADLSIDLNPYEPSSFVIGKLVSKQVILESNTYFENLFFNLVFFSENIIDIPERIFRNCEVEFSIHVFSENADICKVVIAIDWPENTRSIKNMEMFIHKINPEVVEFEYIPI